MNIYKQRISLLQKLMCENKIDFYLVLSTDPYLSEYLSEHYQTRAFLSGFTGSAGTLVITQKKAFLFTDGRYYLQAKKELLGSKIELEKQDLLKWLKQNLSKNSTLASDFALLPLSLKKELDKICKLLHKDFIPKIWLQRPPLPKAQIYEHEAKFCSHTRKEKIRLVREKMNEVSADFHLISSLDDIAWITNLRGSDIEFNPVFLSYLLIFKDKIFLFVDKDKIKLKLQNKLEKEGILLKNPKEFKTELKKLKNANLLLESSKTTALVLKILHKSAKIIDKINPSTLLKACKTPKEIAHIKEAMIEDGIALCSFFAYFEEALKQKIKLSEADIDTKLTEFRAKNALFVSNSFATIAGFNKNGAFIHYKADEKKSTKIAGNGLLLIDSGAQYKNGTTDITRVLGVGKVSKEQKRDYTLVLKAHINLASAIFPQELSMSLLDSLARAPLWSENLDYAHGTGHGVGYFLNVHEAPQSISLFRTKNAHNNAKEGMLTSIEPGIYRKNLWGVRLENLALNVKVKSKSEFGEFLRFEILSLCPFEPKCIDKKMLNPKEKAWLNNYHQKVFEKLAPRLDKKTLKWLKEKTKAL